LSEESDHFGGTGGVLVYNDCNAAVETLRAEPFGFEHHRLFTPVLEREQRNFPFVLWNPVEPG